MTEMYAIYSCVSSIYLPYFEITKACFYFFCAFVFVALGLVHIQFIVPKCRGWSLLGSLTISLSFLGVGVLFVYLICKSFDDMRQISNHAVTVPASVKNLIFPLLPTVGYARVYAVDSPHQVSVSRQSTASGLAS